MSRRTLVLAAVSAVVVGVAIYLIAGRGGSATPPAAAGPSPSAPGAVAGSTPTTTAQPGPKLAGSAAPGAAEPVEAPRAHVPPEIAARALAIAGDRAPAPTGTGKVRTSRGMIVPGEIEAQRQQALTVLAEHPNDVDALRVMVSASCASKDAKTARKYNASLPPGDSADMVKACRDLGVTLVVDNRWEAGKPVGIPEPAKQRQPK